jgi:DNA primase
MGSRRKFRESENSHPKNLETGKMARFSDDELDEIRRSTDIVTLIESYGTKLKQRSDTNEYVGLCPLHDDKDPSLHVNRAKGVWHCKSGCGGGDCFDWVRKAEGGISFILSVDLLKTNQVGLMAGNGTKAKFVPRFESPIVQTASDQELIYTVAEYYHECLTKNVDAIAYLTRRGLYVPEIITQFKIGFCDRTLGHRIPKRQTQSGAEQRERLDALGILKDTGHEAMRGCITFPILLGDNKAGELYGRRITKGTPPNERHWYLKGPHVGVWNADAFTSSDTIILCEGIIDALTFVIAGFHNVTATFGKTGFTDEIFQKFIKSDTKRCYISFDNDSKNDPNDNAAMAAANRLMAQGIECFRIEYPLNANDTNAYAMMLKDGNGSAHGPLQMLINKATWLGKQAGGMRLETGGNAAPKEETIVEQLSSTASPAPSEPEASASDNEEYVDNEPFIEPPARTKPYNIPPACDLFEQAEKRVAEREAIEAAEIAQRIAVRQQTQAPKEENQPAHGKNSLDTSPAQAIVDGPKNLLLLGAETPEASQHNSASQTTVPAKMPAATSGIEAEIKDNEILITIGNRNYRVRGLSKRPNTFDTMKINILVRKNETFFVDTIDLYSAKNRNHFVKEASRELGFEEEIIKRDLGKILQKLELLQDEFAATAQQSETKKIEISDPDKAKALKLLQSKNLIERILADFDACGVVGEQNNKLVGYLAATSRKLKEPLAVLIQSSSAAGKSSLMDAVLAFMPPEEQIKYSAMTGQSLFYMGGTNIKNKILAVAEEEGIEQAAYALKLLQSEGQLNIASTGKDPGTGRMETQEYHVEGPVMIFLTTTSDKTDQELQNRCITLGVCENACHTEAIHKRQRSLRMLSATQLQNDRKAIQGLHQNAQRLIRSMKVVNNYAEQLTFRSDKIKSRRAHGHYLTLIESIALLHQYQREQKTYVDEKGETMPYIEATLDDIEIANRLADQFLERSFAELPERTQVLRDQIIAGVKNLCEFQGIELSEQHFTRKDVRRWSTFGDTQLKEHLARLVDYEYLKVESGGGHGRPIVYTLSYDPDNTPTMTKDSGLMDINRLRLAQRPEEVGTKTLKVAEKVEEVAPPKNESTNENVDEMKSSRGEAENAQGEDEKRQAS